MTPEPLPGQLMLGIAIAIPQPYEAILADWRAKLGDPLAAGTPPHLTILPPTPIYPEQLPDIEKHLAHAATRCQPFTLHLQGTGTFRPTSPVVFVKVVEGEQGCRQVEREVRSGPLADRELSFPYHPHVTVAHQVPDEQLDRGMVGLADFSARFEVNDFCHYVHGEDKVWRLQACYRLGAFSD